MPSEEPQPKKCPVCHGRGYLRCGCWPGDCICGEEEPECPNLCDEGWLDPWDDDFEATPDA